MSSTFFGLYVAGSGLNAANANINTTANNVSNVNTKGYSRQVVNVSEASSLRAYTRYGSVSTGVSTDSVTRERDQYYNQKYWANQSDYGYASEKQYYMKQIENYFTDSKSNPGFTTIFTKMFNNLDALKSNSGDTTYRTNFISTAKQLCSYFNQTSTNLSNMQSSVNDDIKTYVDKINSISQKISVLNSKINVVETGYGHPTANELRDEREKLLDELSTIISVDTDEVKMKDTRTVKEHKMNKNVEEVWNGATNFTVKVNGQILVDGDHYNALTVQTRDNLYNQSDIEGLYDVVWKKDGSSFSVWGDNQKGILRGLFEIRDGNDKENMTGTSSLFYPATRQKEENGQKVFDSNGNPVMELSRDEYGNLIEDPNNTTNTFLKMTLPTGGMSADELSLASQGTVWVNNHSYDYDGFTAQTDAEGKVVSVIFQLENKIPTSQVGHVSGNTMTVGRTVDFKGIPYYQKQMNTFVRTLSRAFNKIQKMGQDANGDAGQAFFVADDKTMNREGNFQLETDGTDITNIDSEYYLIAKNADGSYQYEKNADGTDKLDENGKKIPVYVYETDENGNVKTDTYGNPVKKVNPDREKVHSMAEQTDAQSGKVTYYGGIIRETDDTYYRLTAANFAVADDVDDDPNKFSATINKKYNEELNLGQDAYDIMTQMQKLQSGVKMYRGGTADKFLERIYADVSVDTQECDKFTTNYTTIQQAIDKQRQSISGVDEDEEALNLMKYQQAYNLSAKVISTLTEMYDQLIRNTGV